MAAFFKKFRHIFILLALLAALFAVFGWLWVSAVRDGSDISRLAIVQDNGEATLPLADGVSVSQTLSLTDDCYGFLAAFNTYEKTVFGTVDVTLADEEGRVLATNTLDMSKLKDSVFTGILLLQATANGYGDCTRAGQTVTVSFTAHPATEQDAIGLLYSPKPTRSLKGLENGGETVKGALYLQQVIGYSGARGGVAMAFWLLAGLCTLSLVGGYLLVFVKHARLHNLFLFLALMGGLTLMVVLPAGMAPDEVYHINTVYAKANPLVGQPVYNMENGALQVRSCDAGQLPDSYSLSAYTYQFWADNWHWSAQTSDYVDAPEFRFGSPERAPIWWQYGPCILGVVLARLLGLGWLPMLCLGRLFNLLFYLLGVWLAIRITPVGKKVFFAVALLPMSLSLAASFSYDTVLLELAFLFAAQVLRIAYQPKRIAVGQWLALAITGAVLAPIKNVYLLLLLGVCIIPLKRIKPSKKPTKPLLIVYCALGTVLALGVCRLCWQQVSTYVLPSLKAPAIPLETQAAETDNIYILPNYTVHYALTHVVDTLRLFLNTIQQNTGTYLKMMLGGFLAEPILVTVELTGLLTLLYVLLLAGSTLRRTNEIGPSRWQRFVGLGVFALVVIAIYFVNYLWTPFGSETLWGIQGRYFLPALPLALWAFSPNRINVRSSDTGTVPFGFCLAGIWCSVQVFVTVLALHT